MCGVREDDIAFPVHLCDTVPDSPWDGRSRETPTLLSLRRIVFVCVCVRAWVDA